MGRSLSFFVLGTFMLGSLSGAQTPEGPQPPNPALATVKTICVETFAGDPSLVQAVKEIAIAALYGAKRFTISERCDKTDAVLKGAVIEKAGTRVRAEGEGAGFGVAAGAASTTAAAIGAVAGGSSEALYSRESQTQVSVTARLVDKDGLVIWAHTQESPGGRIKGPVVDAVERALRQLVRDVERAQGARKSGS